MNLDIFQTATLISFILLFPLTMYTAYLLEKYSKTDDGDETQEEVDWRYYPGYVIPITFCLVLVIFPLIFLLEVLGTIGNYLHQAVNLVLNYILQTK